MDIILIINFGILSSLLEAPPGGRATSFVLAGVRYCRLQLGEELLLLNLSLVVQTSNSGNFDIHVHSLDNYLEATIHEDPPALIGCLIGAHVSS